MKRNLTWLFLLAALTSYAATINVPVGSSISFAIRAAREMVRTGEAQQVTITLQPGIHRIDEPLRLRPEDSGLTLSGPGSVISGGVEVKGWRKQGKLFVADAPKQNGRYLEFRQMWVNDRKATRARNVADFEQMARIRAVDKEHQVLWVPRSSVPDAFLKSVPYGLELVLHEMWCVAMLRVRSFTARGDSVAVTFHEPESRVQFSHPWPSPMTPDTGHPSPFYLVNALELLDEPGEWFHDVLAHKIYYYPLPEEAKGAFVATVPALETLVEVTGTPERPVRNIRLEGICFAHTTWMRPSTHGHVPLQAGMPLIEAYKLRPQIDRPNNHKLDNQGWLSRARAAVEISWGEGIDFEACNFNHLGGSGLDYKVGCKQGRVYSSDFSDIAMNGLVVGSFSPEGLETHLPYQPADFREICSQQTIEQSEFYDVSNEDWGCVAICAGYVAGINIEHNTIHDISYTGISLGWGWNRDLVCMRNNKVHANLIYNYAQHTYDCAGIYTLGNQPGTVISENVVRDIATPSYVHDPNHWFYLYTDEGSSNITLRNNWTPSEKFLQNANGPGNVWENNGPQVSEEIKRRAGMTQE